MAGSWFDRRSKGLLIFDVFTGQMTSDIKEVIEKHNFVVVNIPGNMTKYYQVLDLTVNKYAKAFTRKKFNEWYAKEIHCQLDAKIPLEEVNVKLRLPVMRPVHAHWMVKLYNHMTNGEGKKNAQSGWRAAGIQDAVKLGLKNLPTVDTFSDIDPMDDDPRSDGQNLDALRGMSQEETSVAYLREHNEDDMNVCIIFSIVCTFFAT